MITTTQEIQSVNHRAGEARVVTRYFLWNLLIWQITETLKTVAARK